MRVEETMILTSNIEYVSIPERGVGLTRKHMKSAATYEAQKKTAHQNVQVLLFHHELEECKNFAFGRNSSVELSSYTNFEVFPITFKSIHIIKK